MTKSLSAGLSLKGSSWGREGDTLGVAFQTGAISHAAQVYFAAGGLGILIGDGSLVHYGNEDVLESYYDLVIAEGYHAGLDYQLIANPAYNRDRGPVLVLSVRLHGEF